MKFFFHYKNSLTSRLVLAFMLVAVPTILIASGIATHMVTRTFNKAIENWLDETTTYVIESMAEANIELDQALELILPSFSQETINLSKAEEHALRTIGIDYALVKNEQGKILFSLGNLQSVEKKPLYPEGNITWVTTTNEKRELAFVVSKEIEAMNGNKRFIIVAEAFDLEPFFSNTKDSSLTFQIFVPKGNTFEEVYSSREKLSNLSGINWYTLRSTNTDLFLSDPNWTDHENKIHLLLRPLKNSEGKLQAVFVSGVTMSGLDKFISDATGLFWILCIVGVLISGSIGYVVALKIVKPIKRLNQGVANIAAGRFGYQIPVEGSDEVAGLGTSFNRMSKELAVMQQEKVRSSQQERARILGEIAMGFAHEIRNPLLVIKASTEVLYNKIQHNSNDTKLMGFVIEEVDRINLLVSEFLGFAKPGDPTMARESLSELIQTAAALCKARFTQQNIEYLFIQDCKEDTVFCDAKHLQQVLLNLILNALDAMPNGGKLTFQVFHSEQGLCFTITDTGVGISQELIATIYRPFVSAKENGLGLGLSKVNAIIEEHGWTILCSSIENIGTTFTITTNNA